MMRVPHKRPLTGGHASPNAMRARFRPAPAPTPGQLVQRALSCACGGSCPRCQGRPVEPSAMRVSMPGDAYEVEADRVADEVMRMPDGASGSRIERFTGEAVVSPSCAACAVPDTADLSSVVAHVASAGATSSLQAKGSRWPGRCGALLSLGWDLISAKCESMRMRQQRRRPAHSRLWPIRWGPRSSSIAESIHPIHRKGGGCWRTSSPTSRSRVREAAGGAGRGGCEVTSFARADRR